MERLKYSHWCTKNHMQVIISSVRDECFHYVKLQVKIPRLPFNDKVCPGKSPTITKNDDYIRRPWETIQCCALTFYKNAFQYPQGFYFDFTIHHLYHLLLFPLQTAESGLFWDSHLSVLPVSNTWNEYIPNVLKWFLTSDLNEVENLVFNIFKHSKDAVGIISIWVLRAFHKVLDLNPLHFKISISLYVQYGFICSFVLRTFVLGCLTTGQKQCQRMVLWYIMEKSNPSFF